MKIAVTAAITGNGQAAITAYPTLREAVNDITAKYDLTPAQRRALNRLGYTVTETGTTILLTHPE